MCNLKLENFSQCYIIKFAKEMGRSMISLAGNCLTTLVKPRSFGGLCLWTPPGCYHGFTEDLTAAPKPPTILCVHLSILALRMTIVQMCSITKYLGQVIIPSIVVYAEYKSEDTFKKIGWVLYVMKTIYLFHLIFIIERE